MICIIHVKLSFCCSTVSQGFYQSENLENVTGPSGVYGKVKYTIKDGDFGDGDLGLLMYVDDMYPPLEFKVLHMDTHWLNIVVL